MPGTVISRRKALELSMLVLALGGCSGPALGHKPADRAEEKRRVRTLVVREARSLGVSVSLALAVAHAESNFNPRARSPKGARGVMQIMPRTAMGEYGIRAEQLWDPRINVRLGLHFLKRLLKRYRGRTDLALSYYNGGSAVGDLPNARVIPATSRYVARVLRLQELYSAQLAKETI
ncbi:MAG: lytic transglycosylase domain-containing protein [Kiloniellales bacterium]|nr:lytic transglycosylase domain-containing protein [Kiloniellales bacterium]